MRRTVLVALTMAVALVLCSSIALAAPVSGSQGNDTLRGTQQVDQIYGLNGNDTLYGYASSDELYGGQGRDRLVAGSGADELYGGSGPDFLLGGIGPDFINSADSNIDVVSCGGNDQAIDRVVADVGDDVRGCETGDNVRRVQ